MLTRTNDVGEDKANEQGDGRDDLEVDDGLESDAADSLEITAARDALDILARPGARSSS